MDSVVRRLHPGPEPVTGVDADDDAAAGDAEAAEHREAMAAADRQAYWDDLAALRARLAELRAG